MNKTGRRLVKLTDLIIVFAIALVSVFLIFFNGRKTDKPTAVITVDGKEVNRIDLASAEDEVFTLLQGKRQSCPYFRQGDEYTIVRKQN